MKPEKCKHEIMRSEFRIYVKELSCLGCDMSISWIIEQAVGKERARILEEIEKFKFKHGKYETVLSEIRELLTKEP